MISGTQKMDYWHKQQPGKPLFDDVLWSKPERRDQAGRLSIVGGSSSGFWSVASAYQVARRVGVGQVRVIMPDSLKTKLPASVRLQMDDLIMVPSNPSGGLSARAEKYLQAAAGWASNILFVGDNGANAETAQTLVKFLTDPDSSEARAIIARDTVDLLVYDAEVILNRPRCVLVVSLAQFQKIARAVFYPRVVTFSQGVRQVAETLHKFTITYPATIVLFHDDNLIVANQGEVVSQSFDEPMRIWNGEIPTRVAAWLVWQDDPVKAIATSWVEL